MWDVRCRRVRFSRNGSNLIGAMCVCVGMWVYRQSILSGFRQAERSRIHRHHRPVIDCLCPCVCILRDFFFLSLSVPEVLTFHTMVTYWNTMINAAFGGWVRQVPVWGRIFRSFSFNSLSLPPLFPTPIFFLPLPPADPLPSFGTLICSHL